jgi:hypothetical protein
MQLRRASDPTTVTTPNQSPDAQGFLIKDFFLLGTAIWSAGEALQASTRTSKT